MSLPAQVYPASYFSSTLTAHGALARQSADSNADRLETAAKLARLPTPT
jgi:hypothetical protein